MLKPKKELNGYRRFRGYDYSRGATLFVTIVTAPRQNVFGRVVDDRVELNDCGLAAEETFQLEMKRNPALNVMECVIMPDHVHFMVHVRAGSNQPLRQIGQFVANFKRWTKYKVEKLGVTGFGWQENYHDWICLSRDGMDAVAKYIKNNPLKWSLMHGASPPLKVVEPLKDGEVKTEFGKCWQKGCDRAIVKVKGRRFVLICRALRGEKCQKDYDLMFISRVIRLFLIFFIHPLARG